MAISMDKVSMVSVMVFSLNNDVLQHNCAVGYLLALV